MRFFFYGTLRDAGVRTAVLGRSIAVEPAVLVGWRCVRLPGVSFPTLVRDPAGTTVGVLTPDLDTAARRRIELYEGRGYRTRAVKVLGKGGSSIVARVFIRARVGSRRISWHFEDWRRRHANKYRAALKRRLALNRI